MTTSYQAEMPIIVHKAENRVIQQRAIDGYINATDMCKAAGKRFQAYRDLVSTGEFLDALSSNTGITVFDLIKSIRGGQPEHRGIWVHPQVAINLAQWVSPQFAVRVTEWVFEWISGRAPQSMPEHVRRYVMNQHKIPPTHFSMLNAMMLELLAPMERQAYIIPERMMPDISMGRMFSGALRKKGCHPEIFPTYDHEFPDGRLVEARLYPNELRTSFNLMMLDWMTDGRARKYFGDRDETAIIALDRVLTTLPASEPTRSLCHE